MNRQKVKNDLSKLILDNFDKFLETNKNIAKEWNKKTIPLTLLKETSEIGKFKNPDKTDKILNNIEKDNSIMFDKIYQTCESIAKQMNSNEIPIELLEECIKVVKKSFLEGFNNK